MSDDGAWRLPPLRPGFAASQELTRRRAAIGSAPDAIERRRAIGGVPCQIVGDAEAGATLLYFHGGGYRMGSPEGWLGFAATLAAATGTRIVLPDYALAPERPFPAALHDAAAVYRALVEESGAPFVAGDSAGGGLAATLCIAAHAAGAPPPKGAILLSPMLDLAARNETYESRAASDRLFSRAAVLDCAALYLQGHAADDPLVSPLHADPAAYPPLLLLAGGAEVLLGESLAFAQALALANRRVTLHVAPGMGHVWPMLAPDTPAAAEAVAAIAAFVRATS